MLEKTARVRAIGAVAPDVLRVELEMVEPVALEFRPGQFVSVRVDRQGAARRSFSIASPASRQDGFELILRTDGAGKSAGFASGLRPGEQVQFFGPMGFFACAPEHDGDVVFVATGVGVAPMFPMIEEVLSRPARVERGRVLLFWGVRRPEDLFFTDRLDALARRSPRFAYHVSVSAPDADWQGHRGRVTSAVLEATPGLCDPVYYLCGNGDMIGDMTRGLERLGWHGPSRVRTEAFSAAVALGA